VRRISELFSYSRFLFPPFSCIKEKWENETCDRPLRPESASNGAAFKDGDQQIYQGFNSFRNVDNFSRFDRRLFPYSYFPQVRKFLRFVWEDRVYAFRTIPFGLSTAPLVFTRIVQAVAAHLHSQSIFIHSYLNYSLLNYISQFLLRDHTHFVIGLLLKLGFLISWKKSELVSNQDFIFLGEHHRTELGLVFLPEENIVTTISDEQFFSDIVCTSSSIFTADRFLISLMDVIPLDRLNIRQIQWYLRELWYPVTQMWEACIPVLPRLLPHLQWWLQRSNLLTGVPLDPPDSTLTLYTDASLT
jgi:hypothetical protein